MNKQNLDILRVLEEQGFKAYVVGGYVRDYLMKKNSSDIDICTNARPKDLIKIFNAKVPKEKYGSLVVYYKNTRYEITSFRIITYFSAPNDLNSNAAKLVLV